MAVNGPENRKNELRSLHGSLQALGAREAFSAGHFIDSGVGFGVGHVDIPLGGCEFGVAHDLLDGGGSDVAQGQGRGRRVPAGVRGKVPDAGTLQGGVVLLIEVVLVYGCDLPGPACSAAQILKHRV